MLKFVEIRTFNTGSDGRRTIFKYLFSCFELKTHKFFKNKRVNNCLLSIVYNDVLKTEIIHQIFKKSLCIK